MSLTPPSRAEVEQQFQRLLSGEVAQDEVDRWAHRYIAADVEVVDPVVWTALGRLHGIDLPGWPDRGWLHDDEQVAGWLEELRGSEPLPPADY
ncbi:hypothetical protein LZG04_00080 [Saccharothrix sp. S26]|uniref:hypothetical protein n=1 Tax=Saccharothrix sp. S26 TaxID=2907215 RepID=UPI001F2F0A46|nr:hypothetical protein [Saccharothrix sp. S26]MCE6993216.1 hypothetical protein [Saccharothrix sp. S26]